MKCKGEQWRWRGQRNTLLMSCSHLPKKQALAYLSSFFTYQSRDSFKCQGQFLLYVCIELEKINASYTNLGFVFGTNPVLMGKKERKMRSQLPAGRAQSHWSGGSAPCSPCPPAEALPSLPAHPQFLLHSLMQSFPSDPGQPSLHPSAFPGRGSALWNAGPLWLSRWWCSSVEGRGRERKQQKRHRRNKILNFSGGDLLIERDTEGDMSKHSQHLDCD